MTIEQLNYLLRKELYAIKKHKDNIDRIKKEYFDSNYGLKEGDKIRILHEAGDEMIGFLKKVEVCEDGDLYLTIQKQNEKGDRGRGKWNMYLSSKLIKIEILPKEIIPFIIPFKLKRSEFIISSILKKRKRR